MCYAPPGSHQVWSIFHLAVSIEPLFECSCDTVNALAATLYTYVILSYYL
jgi:hypothetical protein